MVSIPFFITFDCEMSIICNVTCKQDQSSISIYVEKHIRDVVWAHEESCTNTYKLHEDQTSERTRQNISISNHFIFREHVCNCWCTSKNTDCNTNARSNYWWHYQVHLIEKRGGWYSQTGNSNSIKYNPRYWILCSIDRCWNSRLIFSNNFWFNLTDFVKRFYRGSTSEYYWYIWICYYDWQRHPYISYTNCSTYWESCCYINPC